MRAVMIILALILAAPSSAEVKQVTLYASGFWEVNFVQIDGVNFCAARSEDPSGGAITLFTSKTSGADLHFYHDDWDTEGRVPVTVRVVIDGIGWKAEGSAMANSMTVFNLTKEFLMAFAGGLTLKLMSEGDTPLFDYSLIGSDNAMIKLGECKDLL